MLITADSARLPTMLLAASLVVAAVTSPAVALEPGGSFFDDDGNVHEAAIEAVAIAGITVGCDAAGEHYCPSRTVTRAEMATFLVRALDLAPTVPVRFVDVTGEHSGSVGAAEKAGWFIGCNPPANDRFCGDAPLTRGQAAAVLSRAFDIGAASEVDFVDDDRSVFEQAIGGLAAAGITRGCNPPANDRFCPEAPVTRAELATFVTRALGLDAIPTEDPFDGSMVLGVWNGLVGYGGLAKMVDVRIPQMLLDDSVGGPVLSPDGAAVAYFDARRACPPDAQGSYDCYSRLFIIPFAGGEELMITKNETRVGGFTWSPDGDELMYIEFVDDETYLRFYDMKTGTVVRSVGPTSVRVHSPSWSSAGRIAASSGDSESVQGLVVLDGDGRAVGSIVEANRSLFLADWSPDGSQLAYSSVSPDATEIVVSGPDGKDRRVVTTDSEVVDMAWSPDGSVIAFVSEFRVWAVRLADGVVWPLTPSDVMVFGVDWR